MQSSCLKIISCLLKLDLNPKVFDCSSQINAIGDLSILAKQFSQNTMASLFLDKAIKLRT